MEIRSDTIGKSMKIHSKIWQWQKGSVPSKHSKQKRGSTSQDSSEIATRGALRVQMVWQITVGIFATTQKEISHLAAICCGMISEISMGNVRDAILSTQVNLENMLSFLRRSMAMASSRNSISSGSLPRSGRGGRFKIS